MSIYVYEQVKSGICQKNMYNEKSWKNDQISCVIDDDVNDTRKTQQTSNRKVVPSKMY